MRILFAGGGTAGHINPALAVANYICEKEDSEVAFVGTEEGLEAELIPRLGHKLYLIRIHGFERKINFQNFKNFFELPRSISSAKRIIREFMPDIVIGTGGYVSGPVLYAAAKMKIPTLIHESNAYPGVTTRILSKYVDTVALGSPAARQYLKEYNNIIDTGNPVRPSILSTGEFEARRKLKLNERPFLVFFGGSLGARDFNAAIVDWICEANDLDKYQILMGTGKFHQYETVLDRFRDHGFKISEHENLKVSEYIYDMDVVMSAADIVISRAGASTLSELTALGKPAILVPSPYVTANHQEYNARAVENAGGAKVILESELNAETLGCAIRELVSDKQKRAAMKKASLSIGTVSATDEIYNEAKRLIEER